MSEITKVMISRMEAEGGNVYTMEAQVDGWWAEWRDGNVSSVATGWDRESAILNLYTRMVRQDRA